MPFVPCSFFEISLVMNIVQVWVGLVGVGLAENVGDGLVDYFIILVRGTSLKSMCAGEGTYCCGSCRRPCLGSQC